MGSKKHNAVHPLNVFTIPLAGPGFQQVIRKQPTSISLYSNLDQPHEIENDGPLFQSRRNGSLQTKTTSPRQGRRLLSDCPKGIEALVGCDHVFVKQSHLITDFFLNVHNKYEVLNSSGEFVFLAAETTPPLTRIFCMGGAPFEISINTLPGRGSYSWKPKGTEVFKLTGNPGSCGCGSEISVSHARKSLGTIEQEGDCTHPMYTVKDPTDKELFKIQGPSKPHCFSCGFTTRFGGGGSSNLRFDIFKADGKTGVGRIAKQLAEPSISESQAKDQGNSKNTDSSRRKSISDRKCEREMWGIRFPSNSDSQAKGLLLSALFLLEYQYYSRN